jgi:hypothetical protein
MTTNASIVRLRKANPFPELTTADGAALFERITALPLDSRLRKPATPYRRRVVVLAASLAVMALLASTAFAISNWVTGGAVKPPVTKGEYRRAQHALTLPPGYTWPTLHISPNTVTGQGAGGGHAVVAAQNAWECYWVQSIHNGDNAAQQRAHNELDALLAGNVIVAPANASENWTPPNPPKAPYAVFADDGGVESLKATYAQAAAGRPQRLIDSCRANAPR